MNKFFDSTIKISQEVLFQEISGETVLLDLNSEAYYGLDLVATRIWQLLQDNCDLRAIMEILEAEFEVGPEELERDLIHHLGELEAIGLIELVE